MPLWRLTDDSSSAYSLTKEARLACGLGATDEEAEQMAACSSPRQSPPPPPPTWVWPYEGEEVEVEVQLADDEPAVWVAGVVSAVLVDSWFQVDICAPNGDEWKDWFTWQEEAVDWRRSNKPRSDLLARPKPKIEKKKAAPKLEMVSDEPRAPLESPEEDLSPIEDDGRPLPMLNDFIILHGSEEK